jgi:hypothetical protein
MIKLKPSKLDPLCVNVSADADTMAKLNRLMSESNYSGQAPASAAENIEESLPVPGLSFDTGSGSPEKGSGVPSGQTEPAVSSYIKPVASQVLNVPVNQGEEEALPLPVLNFEKPGKKVAPVTTRNAPAVNHEDVLELPQMSFQAG